MSKAALSATDRMEAAVTEGLLRTEKPALADWMEFFKTVRVHVYIRFGLWDELKQLRPLEDGRLYCVTNVMRHYGRDIAHAATGKVDEADAERALFRRAARLVPPERLDFPNRIRDILLVAAAMLDGEIEYRRGNYAESFGRLRDAVALEDELPFAEPWGWMLPARHAYAALSLEQGDVEQAAVAYAEDLGLRPTPKRANQHPNNVWALHGYHECLVRLGRDAEASIIKRQLTLAAAEADVDVTSSTTTTTTTTPLELRQHWLHRREVALLDVREKGPYAESHPFFALDATRYVEYHAMTIPGSRSCPGGELLYRLFDAAPDPATTVIVLTSPDGAVSSANVEHASQAIAGSSSVRQVLHLIGGTAAWKAAGHALDAEPKWLSEPIDVYKRPYEGTGNAEKDMQGYIDWEHGLVAQVANDGVACSRVSTSCVSRRHRVG
ncbi:hypothetical protein CSHISOI_07883, partial [Colletotrichum shisoi]